MAQRLKSQLFINKKNLDSSSQQMTLNVSSNIQNTLAKARRLTTQFDQIEEQYNIKQPSPCPRTTDSNLRAEKQAAQNASQTCSNGWEQKLDRLVAKALNTQEC
jgi:hypothetical protein